MSNDVVLYVVFKCIGKVGKVIGCKGVDVTVDFDNAGRWTFNETGLNKVLIPCSVHTNHSQKLLFSFSPRFCWMVGWLVVFGFNATLTTKILS